MHGTTEASDKIVKDARIQMKEILDHIDMLHSSHWTGMQGSLMERLIDLESILEGDLEIEEEQ